MLVKQLSVFVENKTGKISEIANILAKNEIDISALQLADSEDYGVLRLIVNDSDRANSVLKNAGIVCKITEVLALAMDDSLGSFANVINVFNDANINIKYIYACISKTNGKAFLVFSVDDVIKAEKVIKDKLPKNDNASDIYRI